MTAPSTTGPDGRDGRGRFASGNRIAKGNPHAARVARLRSAVLSAVSEEDMAAIVQRLVALAKEGNVQAAREILERCLGKAEAIDALERIEQLEEQLAQTLERGAAR